MRTLFTYACFLFLVAAVAATGAVFQPGAWYAALTKPAWTPPDVVFPLAWTILYIFIAVAGARVWLRSSGSERRLPFLVYGLQLLANAAWSWLFFGLHLMFWGFVDILVLLGLSLILIVLFWRIDRLGGALLIPYAIWVLYAATLNGGILLLN